MQPQTRADFTTDCNSEQILYYFIIKMKIFYFILFYRKKTIFYFILFYRKTTIFYFILFYRKRQYFNILIILYKTVISTDSI